RLDAAVLGRRIQGLLGRRLDALARGEEREREGEQRESEGRGLHRRRGGVGQRGRSRRFPNEPRWSKPAALSRRLSARKGGAPSPGSSAVPGILAESLSVAPRPPTMASRSALLFALCPLAVQQGAPAGGPTRQVEAVPGDVRFTIAGTVED